MNAILETIYPDKDVVARRRRTGLPPLSPRLDEFVAYLHEEMRACYLNGHDHAALVTACALIEAAIKDAIYFDQFIKDDCVFNPDSWDKIDELEFGNAINMAKGRRVVTKADWDRLEWIRQHIRNVYMHGQTPDWIKDKDEALVEGNLGTGEVRERTVAVRDNLAIQRIIRIAADRNICDTVVRLVDGLVRGLAGRAATALKEWKQKNPSKPTREQVDRVLENMQRQGLSSDLIVMNDVPIDLPPVGRDEGNQ